LEDVQYELTWDGKLESAMWVQPLGGSADEDEPMIGDAGFEDDNDLPGENPRSTGFRAQALYGDQGGVSRGDEETSIEDGDRESLANGEGNPNEHGDA
jgi:hypothetical protein